MADKAIGDLNTAPGTVDDSNTLFVVQQNGTAYKLTGHEFILALTTILDGHGGISSIAKTSTSGLTDTYTITYADRSTSTFTVKNGRAVSSITTYYAVSSNGTTAPSSWSTTRQSMTSTNRYLWSYQSYAFNDGTTTDTIASVIGVWGDKGNTGATGRGIADLEAGARVPGQYTPYTFTMTDGTTEVFRAYDGVGISGVAKISTSGLVDTYRITFTDSTYTDYSITNAKSITSVTKSGTSGLVDTYTVAFNDGTTTTFNVTNGVGISSIAKTSTAGLVDTYTVTLSDNTTTTFTVTNAKSIVSVTQIAGTHAAGTSDTYRITFNDGDTTEFQVYNGANGAGSVSTVDGIQANNQDVPLLTIGNGAPTTATPGNLKSRYFDANSGILYICVNVDTSQSEAVYSWIGAGVPVDTALSTTSTNPVQNKAITAKVGTATLDTTAQNLSSAVNELNAAMLAKADRSTIAAQYSSSRTYNPGDYCYQSYKLYRCTATTTGTFDSTKWQETKVTDFLLEYEVVS